MLTKEVRQQVIDDVVGINKGPRALMLYMDICARCGTCEKVCHVAQANPARRTNPAVRSDHLRAIYKRYGTLSGRLLGQLVGADNHRFTDDVLDQWERDFYECSGCRRCAQFCPVGIDNSIITRKGRAILHKLGRSPKYIAKTQQISDETGNDEGQSYKAFMEAVRFLQEEMKEMTGHDIPIPVDKKGAEILFVPASADLVSFPDTQIGSSMFFYVAGMDWTMSSEAFDGANFGLFSGDDAHMKRKNKLIHDAMAKLGCKKLVIGECGHAYRIAKRMAPGFWGKLPYEVTNILEMAADFVNSGKANLDKSKVDFSVTYHDPCNMARSLGVVEEPREILRHCVKDFREMTPKGTENWCCGGGGGLAVMDGREGVDLLDGTFLDYRMKVGGEMKWKQVAATKAHYLAAPCSNCKRQLSQLMEHHKSDIEVGGVMDLFAKALVW
ncbi:MAG: (Fe-S)-binding protein [Acidobacteriota bacterium]